MELFSRVAAHGQAPVVEETRGAEPGLILRLLQHVPLLRCHHIDSVSLGLVIDLQRLHVLVLSGLHGVRGLPQLDLLLGLGLRLCLQSLLVHNFVLQIVQVLSRMGLLLLLLLLLTRLRRLGRLSLRCLLVDVDSLPVLRRCGRQLLHQQVLQSVLILVELILILGRHERLQACVLLSKTHWLGHDVGLQADRRCKRL